MFGKLRKTAKYFLLFLGAAIPVFSQTATTVQRFEVASVKRNNSGIQVGPSLSGSAGRYVASNQPLRVLMQVAYHVQAFQIIGAPDWIDSERYDIEGKAEADLSTDQKAAPLLQTLIEERFKAVMHRETRDLPVYFLTTAKSGSKLKASQCIRREPNKPVPPDQPRSAFCGYLGVGSGGTLDASTQMQNLTDVLSAFVRRKVLDRTGLAGYFDVKLKWTPSLGLDSNPAPASDSGPSIFTAVEEQLGLKLESGKAPIDVLVIDHLERPSEN